MFTPDLDLKVVSRCSKFSILDKTGVDTGDGTKWSGVSGLNPATVTLAVIVVISPSGIYYEADILSQIPSPVTGEFTFNDMTGTGVDGLHTLVYKLETSSSITITAFADYSGTVGDTVLITSAGHGLVTGMHIKIDGSTNYDGNYYLTKVDDDNFYITSPWFGNDGSCTGYKSYESKFYPYVYCRVEAKIFKMFANLSMMKPGKERDRYLEDARTAKGLLEALKSAISSSNVDALNDIQAEINRIVDFNEVNLNL